MNLKQKFKFGIFVLAVSTLVGCKDKDKDEVKEFDRSKMLVNLDANVIQPRYANLKSEVVNLKSAFEDFKTTPDAVRLSALKSAFESSYISWQYCAAFEFGPAMNVALRAFTNTYPTDTTKIEDNISNGSYNLSTASNTSATGFPALDYLLFKDSDINTLNAFTVDANAADRMQYLQDLVNKMETEISSVADQWSNTYGDEFKTSTGNDVGSSTGLLVNEMNRDFELIKHAEVGIPLGKQTLDITRPTYVQGYYSQLSNTLFETHLIAILDLYKGVGFTSQTDGVGFDDYLNALEAKSSEGGSLDDKIKEQFANMQSLFGQVNNTFSVAVDQENSQMNALYEEIQKTVVYLKTDLPSSIGVQITYQDNDGD